MHTVYVVTNTTALKIVKKTLRGLALHFFYWLDLLEVAMQAAVPDFG